MMAGHVNGGGMRNGSAGDDKVASLDDARRRAAARAKDAKRKRAARRLGRMTPRAWIGGSLFVAMARGVVWHWISPLVGATGATR
jgi:hypothetical protein